MYKSILLLIICLLLFVSCKPNKNENTNNTLTLPAQITSIIHPIEPEPAPSFEHAALIEDEPTSSIENTSWIEAYADYFMTGKNPPYFMLLDFNFDNIPELIFYASGYGASAWVIDILSYSETRITQLRTGGQLPAQFELYKDKETGKTRWMSVMNYFMSDYLHYHNEWRWFDFNDSPDVSTELILGWDLDETKEEEIYSLRDKNTNEMIVVEYEEIDKRRQEFFAKYEKIETQRLSDNDYYGGFNRELFIEFLLKWEQ